MDEPITTKAYQCSRCRLLYDVGDYCSCLAGIDPRIGHREKGDAARCREGFGRLETDRRWHEKFAWEEPE